jgi:hypothetical protein
MIKISILFSLFLLAACSTNPIKRSNAQQVEDANQWKYQKRINDEQGSITLIRDSGFIGSACDTLVHINKEKIAKLSSSEFMDIFINPGSYTLGIEPNSPCAGEYYDFPLTVGKNEEKSFRLGAFKSKFIHKRNNISIEPIE